MSSTTVIMAALFACIVVWDIYLAIDKKDGNTISERMRFWAKVWPPFRLIISFGFGLLAGHWYW